MRNSSCQQAGLKAMRDEAAEILSNADAGGIRADGGKAKVEPYELNYYSFPKVYGSTAGPFGGIGGQSITAFQIEAFEDPYGRSVWFCGGRVIPKPKGQGEPVYGFVDAEEVREFCEWREKRDADKRGGAR